MKKAADAIFFHPSSLCRSVPNLSYGRQKIVCTIFRRPVAQGAPERGYMKVQNPVLCGFNPDPSLLRVGEDYYIATSTFEWFPGVCIHHSRDLVNWEIADYALKDDTVLDMTGLDGACGIWAPNLTWSNGKFLSGIYDRVYESFQT